MIEINPVEYINKFSSDKSMKYLLDFIGSYKAGIEHCYYVDGKFTLSTETKDIILGLRHGLYLRLSSKMSRVVSGYNSFINEFNIIFNNDPIGSEVLISSPVGTGDRCAQEDFFEEVNQILNDLKEGYYFEYLWGDDTNPGDRLGFSDTYGEYTKRMLNGIELVKDSFELPCLEMKFVLGKSDYVLLEHNISKVMNNIARIISAIRCISGHFFSY